MGKNMKSCREANFVNLLERVTKERDDALANVETLKVHVKTLQEAWEKASVRLREFYSEQNERAS